MEFCVENTAEQQAEKDRGKSDHQGYPAAPYNSGQDVPAQRVGPAGRLVVERQGRAAVLALRRQGSGVLMISEDLEELLLLSDRIVVMFEGRIMDTLPADAASVERIGLLMAGVREAA